MLEHWRVHKEAPYSFFKAALHLFNEEAGELSFVALSHTVVCNIDKSDLDKMIEAYSLLSFVTETAAFVVATISEKPLESLDNFSTTTQKEHTENESVSLKETLQQQPKVKTLVRHFTRVINNITNNQWKIYPPKLVKEKKFAAINLSKSLLSVSQTTV